MARAAQERRGATSTRTARGRAPTSGLLGWRPTPEDSFFTVVGMGISRTRVRVPLAGSVQRRERAGGPGRRTAVGGEPFQRAGRARNRLAGARAGSSRCHRERGFRVLVDYAHTEDAPGASVLDALRDARARGRLICVFGCGGDRDRGKRAPMGRAVGLRRRPGDRDQRQPAQRGPRAHRGRRLAGMAGTRRGGRARARPRAAPSASAVAAARPGDVVLIAGKGHETSQTIGATFDGLRRPAGRRRLPARAREGALNVMRLSDVLASTGAVLVRGDAARLVHGVSTDTRSLGEHALFVALSGPNFDGNALRRGQAARAGAAGADPAPRGGPRHQPRVPARPAGAPCTDAPRRALADLAAWHRSRLGVPVSASRARAARRPPRTSWRSCSRRRRARRGSPELVQQRHRRAAHAALGRRRDRGAGGRDRHQPPGEIAALCRIARPTVGDHHQRRRLAPGGAGLGRGRRAREGRAVRGACRRTGSACSTRDCRYADELRSRDARARHDLQRRRRRRTSTPTRSAVPRRRDDVPPASRRSAIPWTGRGHLAAARHAQRAEPARRACGVPRARDSRSTSVLPAVVAPHGGRRRMERRELGELHALRRQLQRQPRVRARQRCACSRGCTATRRRVLVLGDMLELGELGPRAAPRDRPRGRGRERHRPARPGRRPGARDGRRRARGRAAAASASCTSAAPSRRSRRVPPTCRRGRRRAGQGQPRASGSSVSSSASPSATGRSQLGARPSGGTERDPRALRRAARGAPVRLHLASAMAMAALSAFVARAVVGPAGDRLAPRHKVGEDVDKTDSRRAGARAERSARRTRRPWAAASCRRRCSPRCSCGRGSTTCTSCSRVLADGGPARRSASSTTSRSSRSPAARASRRAPRCSASRPSTLAVLAAFALYARDDRTAPRCSTSTRRSSRTPCIALGVARAGRDRALPRLRVARGRGHGQRRATSPTASTGSPPAA